MRGFINVFVPFVIVFLFCSLPISSPAQSKAKSNRPPWVEGKPSSWQAGELPRIDLRGNLLKTYFGVGKTREEARKNTELQLVANVTSQRNVELERADNLQTIVENSKRSSGRRVKENYSDKIRYESDIKISGKTVARYTLLDEYYEYVNGNWHCAGLFLLAEEGMSLANIPPITYSLDRGAWRSIVIPGWAQLYTRRTFAGIGYMAVQAGLIGSTIYFHQHAEVYKQRMNEAYSIDIKEGYKKHYENSILYRNISAGVCVVWYALNVIDAFTSQRGRLRYTTAYGQMNLSLAPTMMMDNTSSMGYGLVCGVNF